MVEGEIPRKTTRSKMTTASKHALLLFPHGFFGLCDDPLPDSWIFDFPKRFYQADSIKCRIVARLNNSLIR